MSKQPSHPFMVTHALEALRTGSLPTAIPGLLMDEFHISAAQASELAALAIKRHKKPSKLDTKLLDEPGEANQ